MKLYVGVIIDRHIDPVIAVFSDQEKAIDWARSTFRDYMAHPEMIEEEPLEGYLWSARYGEEEDHAWVEEATLDEPE